MKSVMVFYMLHELNGTWDFSTLTALCLFSLIFPSQGPTSNLWALGIGLPSLSGSHLLT